MKIILLGAFATGKGTQAEKLAKEMGIPHISTGDMFREELKKQTELGLKAKEYMDRGNLVPDGVTIAMLKERLPDTGFILDGFPRTVPQADALGEITSIDLVINIDIPEQEIIKRVTGRLTCQKCGAIYHEQYIPPKQPNICNKCGGELGKRADETEEAVKQRFATYEEKSKPLIDYYENKDLLKNVDGTGSPEMVFIKIKQILKKDILQ